MAKQCNSQAQCDIAISVIIVFLEDVRHPLETNAGLDEEIEAHGALASPVVGSEQQLDKLGAKAVPKCLESFDKLVERNVPATIGIEAVEEVAPCCEKAPESAVAGQHVRSGFRLSLVARVRRTRTHRS
jgi:hypothetical protein